MPLKSTDLYQKKQSEKYSDYELFIASVPMKGQASISSYLQIHDPFVIISDPLHLENL
jgi:hypothetical protein